jgi:hypothetical protein
MLARAVLVERLIYARCNENEDEFNRVALITISEPLAAVHRVHCRSKDMM